MGLGLWAFGSNREVDREQEREEEGRGGGQGATGPTAAAWLVVVGQPTVLGRDRK